MAALLVMLLTACTIGAESSGQPGSDSVGYQSDTVALRVVLDSIVGGYLRRHSIPGMAVGVVRDGQTVYARGFGVADEQSGRAVTEQTLFHLASVSKTFVATAVLQLAESNAIELDSSVQAYLPYFQLDDDRATSITIRQMLSHTSGMPDVRDYQWDAPEYDDGALERYVRSLRDRRLDADPGTQYAYSNMAYEVLGDVIAKVSGMSFEDYSRERLFKPLGMENSTFSRTEVDPNVGATPHVGRRAEISPIYPYHRAHAPSSTLHSSAFEMCNWITANVNRGLYGGNRILVRSGYALLWSPHAEVRPGRRLGLGWMLADSPYGLWAFHGGRDVGFRSQLSVFPDIRAGVVILSNWSDTPIPELRDALIRASFRPKAR